MTDPKPRNWQLETDNQHIAWLTLNVQAAALNTLSQAVIHELGEILAELNIQVPKGVVIQSAKSNGFVAGADIEEFTRIDSEAEALALMENAQRVFRQLEDLPCPTVALIHGFCLGGGLEMALACKVLIAEDEPSCKLGLPEVKLGIHPGFGGSVRLIERIGAPKAMDLMLSGRVVVARVAKKLGFVDQIVAKRYFETAASQTILSGVSSSRPSLLTRTLNTRPARAALASYLSKQVRQRVRPDHYPAPFALIEVWREFAGDRDTFLKEESKSVARLHSTDTAHQLVRLFFLQEALKKAGKSSDVAPIKHLHVIGAGVMGGDIAAWSALRGLKVTLQDNQPESIARAMQRAHALFKKKLKIKRLIQAAMDRLTPDLAGNGINNADLIIEAIFENLEVKQQVFSELEAQAKASAILASNTSSIPIEAIAEALNAPQRLVGIHFFNPVAKMQLVEVVAGQQTASESIQSASAYAVQINRLPVEVKSSPGFLVNRALMPYLVEAATLVDEGVSAPLIDSVAVEFGMPMGPIELADVVGLDICQHVATNILQSEALPQSLTERVDKGDLGKKTGQGFYRWSKGKAQKPARQNTDHDQQQLVERLIYPLLNECVACLREQVVTDTDHLDAGIIFGTGFAPFKGGPSKTIEQLGAEHIRDALTHLQTKLGDRFKPDEGWKALI